MSGRIRFHLDENMSNVVRDFLRDEGFDVTTPNDVGLLSAPDELQLTFCVAERRVLITRDSDFLRLNRRGMAHAGIIFCHEEIKVGPIRQQLKALCETADPAELAGRVEYLRRRWEPAG